MPCDRGAEPWRKALRHGRVKSSKWRVERIVNSSRNEWQTEGGKGGEKWAGRTAKGTVKRTVKRMVKRTVGDGEGDSKEE